MGKNVSNKYGQKLIDIAKKSTTDATKIASKKNISKRTEAAGDLIGNKIADEITSVSRKSPTELHSQNGDRIHTQKERYISTEKGNKLLMN